MAGDIVNVSRLAVYLLRDPHMRIKSVRLTNYKRFNDLTISGLPQTARLVVLVGPNGTGKSSVFDSFLLKSRAAISNLQISGNQQLEQYYESTQQSRTTHDVANRVHIEFHDADAKVVDLKRVFQVRSAYRNEADFRLDQLQAVRPEDEANRLVRIIDPDLSVSKNYARMAWKRMQDLDRDAPAEQTIGDYRKKSLGELQQAMQDLFSEPILSLQDFGGINAGSFRFSKGAVNDFHYKNLSGGEKAAFDVLLDVFLKRDETKEAVFCIDEPELHVSTSLQGRLIAAVLDLLREKSQLWIATHSIGVVREAYRIQASRPDEVVFLDFSGRDFDEPVCISPSATNRLFWKNTYEIVLDDLSSLVAPQRIVICEGSKDKNVSSFDARCYNKLFVDESPETLFISQGGSKEVMKSDHLVTILTAIASGIEVWKLIDRDDMADYAREQKINSGVRVLNRRELEEYLYDREVIRNFLLSKCCDENVIGKVLDKREEFISGQHGPRNVKEFSRSIFDDIRRIARLPNLGNSREEFALQFLVPALRKTDGVYDELRGDVFGP